MRFRRLATLTLICSGLVAVAGVSETLGDYQWGATPGTIIAQTGAVPDSRGAGTLVKRETILGREAYVTYQFDDNGLSTVGIQWDEEIFSVVKQVLDRDYGSAQCATGEKNCRWTSAQSTVRLVETPALGVTLLVFSKRA